MGAVLVIDDEPNIVLLLKTVIQQEGHRVITAYDGQAGFECLKMPPLPDLVVVDLNMPIINGHEFIAKMKEDPSLKEIPVIVITGSDLGLETLPPKENYNILINKPFDLRDLTNAVSFLVENASCS